MNFDPAIAARDALRAAEQSGEVGSDWPVVCEAEDTFSSSAGEEATSAYLLLQDIGARHPEARALQQFLIYITWQQVIEHTSPTFFSKGLELCDRYLARWGTQPDTHLTQISALRTSFRAGLGIGAEEPHEYDRDTVKGGD